MCTHVGVSTCIVYTRETVEEITGGTHARAVVLVVIVTFKEPRCFVNVSDPSVAANG